MSFSDNEKLPDIFRNLKKHVKSHLKKSKTHINNLNLELEKQNEEKRRKGKNYEAGMNLGRLSMKLYLMGRPYTDYEYDVLNLKQDKIEVGHMNHSRKFPAAFRPHVHTVVKTQLTKFLTSKLPQTGHRPPLALSADKATYKHRSRQFLGAVTVVPGGPNLLEVISGGQPIVKDGSGGLALTQNMKSGFDELEISSCQIESTVFDGVYFHCNIQMHFSEVYGINDGDVLYSYDTLHKSGLVDTHMCKKKEFKWVVEDTIVCQSVFNTFNWGANYEKLVKATVLWKLHLRNLVGFSETRFANSRRQVYVNIHHEFPAIMTCLEQQIIDGIGHLPK